MKKILWKLFKGFVWIAGVSRFVYIVVCEIRYPGIFTRTVRRKYLADEQFWEMYGNSKDGGIVFGKVDHSDGCFDDEEFYKMP